MDSRHYYGQRNELVTDRWSVMTTKCRISSRPNAWVTNIKHIEPRENAGKRSIHMLVQNNQTWSDLVSVTGDPVDFNSRGPLTDFVRWKMQRGISTPLLVLPSWKLSCHQRLHKTNIDIFRQHRLTSSTHKQLSGPDQALSGIFDSFPQKKNYIYICTSTSHCD